MEDNMTNLKNRIQKLKHKLDEDMNNLEKDRQDILKQSQELDELILEYVKLEIRNNKNTKGS